MRILEVIYTPLLSSVFAPLLFLRLPCDGNFYGVASFDYTVTDDTDIATASVEVMVNSVEDLPVAIDDTATTEEDTPIVILASELLANDINYDPEDSLSLVAVNNSVRCF